MKTREPGTIKEMSFDDERSQLFINIEYDSGGTQGFGGVVLNDYRHKYTELLFETFGVKSWHELFGKRCVVLRSFPDDECIEGLEAEDGKRFTRTIFLRETGLNRESALQRRRAELQNKIGFHNREKQRLVDQLFQLTRDYVEWS